MIQPTSVDILPDGIHIEWDDDHHGRFPHRSLRAECPCAGCVHEMTGKRMVTYETVDEDVEAIDHMTVGRYALQFLWSDGHDTGIYPYQLLRNISLCDDCVKART